MKCKNCEKEFEGQVCPECGTTAEVVAVKKKKPIYKKWWFWVLIILIVGIIAGSSGGGSEEATSGDGQQDTSVSQQENTETEEKKEESNVYKVGDTIDAKGLKLTYQKAEEWESDNMFLQPEEGMKYIRIYIVAENTSSTDRYVFSTDFSCYADNVKMEEMYLSGDKTFMSDSISSGRRTEGYFYFSVPENAKNIEIEYETSWCSGKKAILKVEL